MKLQKPNIFEYFESRLNSKNWKVPINIYPHNHVHFIRMYFRLKYEFFLNFTNNKHMQRKLWSYVRLYKLIQGFFLFFIKFLEWFLLMKTPYLSFHLNYGSQGDIARKKLKILNTPLNTLSIGLWERFTILQVEGNFSQRY